MFTYLYNEICRNRELYMSSSIKIYEETEYATLTQRNAVYMFNWKYYSDFCFSGEMVN